MPFVNCHGEAGEVFCVVQFSIVKRKETFCCFVSANGAFFTALLNEGTMGKVKNSCSFFFFAMEISTTTVFLLFRIVEN